jgi:hypothetical protein
LLNGLKKKIKETKSEWAELLNEILWAYKTTQKTFTSETSFLLIYGTKDMIQIEIGCPSHQVVNYISEGNEQGLRTNLDFLEKSHLLSAIRNEAYRLRTT